MTRSRGRWLGWAGWAGIAALLGIAAWLFPDPLHIGESRNRPPNLQTRVTSDSSGVKSILEFMESHETQLVYLDLEIPGYERA
jgi:hypothetical protein